MLGTSFILLLQLHSQSAVLEHGGLLMIEQAEQSVGDMLRNLETLWE